MLLIAPIARAQVAVDWTIGVRNQYTLSYIGKVVHPDPVIQGDVWWTLPHGFWADVWYSTTPTFEPNFGREVDYGAGWANEHVMVGFYYYDLYEQFSTDSIGDVTETFVKASWPIKERQHQITPYVEANYLYATRNQRANNGAFPMAGMKHHWEKIVWLVDMSQDVALVYDGGVFGSDQGFVFRYQASLAMKPASWITFRLPYFRVHVPLSGGIHDRTTEPQVGADIVIHHTFLEAPDK